MKGSSKGRYDETFAGEDVLTNALKLSLGVTDQWFSG